MNAEKVLELSTKGLENLRNGIDGNAMEQFHALVEMCKDEINNKLAKDKGGQIELKRKNVAEKMFKKMGHKPSMQGFKRFNDKIAICDGFIGYLGREITGIKETEDPDHFLDVPSLFKNSRNNSNEHNLSLNKLKANYKIDKAEAKSKGIKTSGKNPEVFSFIALDNKTPTKTHFNLEILIMACELLGVKDEFVIKIGNKYQDIAYIKYDNNEVIICPFRPKTI